MNTKIFKNFEILPREFYQNDTPKVAKNLLGKKLIRRVGQNYIVGIICETEAYRADDPASHCYTGKTERNKAMFGTVGCAYIYVSYGIHFCFNIVARDTQLYDSGGVLIRAVIPIEGIKTMQNNRPVKLTNISNGPGKLTQAYGITTEHYGLDLTCHASDLFVANAPIVEDNAIVSTPRIGISRAKAKLWRFVLSNK